MVPNEGFSSSDFQTNNSVTRKRQQEAVSESKFSSS